MQIKIPYSLTSYSDDDIQFYIKKEIDLQNKYGSHAHDVEYTDDQIKILFEYILVKIKTESVFETFLNSQKIKFVIE